MDTSCLDINIKRYPKLQKLLDTNIAESSKFLTSIKNRMSSSVLTYNQVLAACTVIDEKSPHVREER